MASVVFYFQIHQPYRLKPYSVFGIGEDRDYFQAGPDNENFQIINKVAEKCYLPTNEILLKLLKKHPDFKVSFSISGLALEQLNTYSPQVIDSFKSIIATGQAELLAETYFHSLAFLKSESEFVHQVERHIQAMNETFGHTPKALRNTELLYNNDLAKLAESMGFDTILAEGVDRHLGWRSPNFVYKPKGCQKIKLLLKNYRLSDDIAFRFSNRDWEGWPLTASKFAGWIRDLGDNSEIVNLFMDYETYGEHQWQDTGIFDFLAELPDEVFKTGNTFKTVTEASSAHLPADEIDMPNLTSWADLERDASAWVSNPLQNTALDTLFSMEDAVMQSSDDALINDWRRLSTSDHFYYMSTKAGTDAEVHQYFSPYESPFAAYTNYMNVLHDIQQRVYDKSGTN